MSTGDSLTEKHVSMKFGTYDQDNDNWPLNCGKEYESGWWYDRCSNCDLNGHYYNEPAIPSNRYGSGVEWESWKGEKYSLKGAEMKLRQYYPWAFK